ncbi:MAG: hypothetical protein A3G38_02935 [Omnitrophica WOR_2 bacterium RIFCSPLOWO2_12_FULL_51_8]|nr:MAG: hypothetical protein A3G38_02935 [Omnitrophica WOR_2 bacterium RIFCSPLOWO2_12_FULL_51_8]
MKPIFKLIILAATILAAATQAQAEDSSTVDYVSLAQFEALSLSQIQAAAAVKTMFRHASVGSNVNDGLNALATSNAAYNRANFSFQSRGNPGWQAKIQDLIDQTRTQLANFSVFSMKFCYVDGAADVNAYIQAMENLESTYPLKKFMWWTMPTTTSGVGQAFNTALRTYAASHNKLLLDIASIESHRADGSACTNAGRECLCAEYTTDGGHLNPAGAQRVAKGFWVMMAKLSGASATNTVPPTARNDTAATAQDQALTIHVLANDFDLDGDTLQIVNLTQPNNGMAAVTSDQRITYSPNAGFTGADIFTYMATDGQDTTPAAQVEVNVNPQIIPPVTDSTNQSMLLSASVITDPPRIALYWPAEADVQQFEISRKLRDETVWTNVAIVAGATTSYIDSNVEIGKAYEYRIQEVTTGNFVRESGYIYAGIDMPLVESRGKVILLVDQTQAAPLAAELTRLGQDLAGDGWIVLRHDVSRTDSVINIKSIIKADYDADPANVKSVFLFGHVPVPYSGSVNPDAHPDHYGAWPADGFYGDMNGTWTDSTINIATASDPRNRNIPGDGKFDQNTFQLNLGLELQVGRVDLSNLPAFSRNETELLRQYLNKDHNFRHGIMTAQARGLIDDINWSGEGFAASGWRNFATFFGSSNIVAADWMTTLSTESYLWGYGWGPGSYTSASGVATTAQLAASDPRVVFTMLFGSYFGDWDSQDNLLRAALATPTYTLTSAWAGRPQWEFHHMALGETIGFDTRVSQNSDLSIYRNGAGNRGAHIALMGDPTLRMHVVAPVMNAAGSRSGANINLSWTASADDIAGYHVYRQDAAGAYQRLNESLVHTTSFEDPNAPAGAVYMVRAVKLEKAASGAYYNASQGIFWQEDGSILYGDVSGNGAVTAYDAGLALAQGRGALEAAGIAERAVS